MTTKILTVDDNKVIRTVVKGIFEPYKCEIFEAENGAEGLKKAKEQKPDVMVLDITMPIMNGVVMLEKVKKSDELKHIPVIMLTSEKNKKLILQVLKLGATDYIMKPVNEKYLLERVHKLVNLEYKIEQKEEADHKAGITGDADRRTEDKAITSIYKRIQNEQISSFTFYRKGGAVFVTILPHFSKDDLVMFEMAMELAVFFNILEVAIVLNITTELDKDLCNSVADAIKWVKDNDCEVELTAPDSEEGRSVLNYFTDYVFEEEAYWKEQHHKIEQFELPYLYHNKDGGLCLLHIGGPINYSSNLSLFKDEADKIIKANPKRVIIDLLNIELMSDDFVDVLVSFVKNLQNKGGAAEFICNKFDVLTHLQTRIPKIKWYRHYKKVKI